VSRMSSVWRRASILDGARTDRATIFPEGTENLVVTQVSILLLSDLSSTV
jgi:hypothetical protein